MTHIEELKRIRSIFSAITGFEDDDDEYLLDARKAVEQLIDKLEAQPQHEQDGCPVCGSDVHDRDALDKAEREIERLSALVAQPLIHEQSAERVEPVVWGVDWGHAGEIPCVSIIKRLPNGGIKVMAVEYAPYAYNPPPAAVLKEKNDQP